MNETLPRAQFLQKSKLKLIDCDIHPRLRSIADLKPYLSTRWWDTIQTYGMRKRHGFVKGHPYPKSQPGDGARRDSWPENGDPSGSSLPLMQQQHLDYYGVDIGVMNPLWPGSGERLRERFGLAAPAPAATPAINGGTTGPTLSYADAVARAAP